MPKDILSVEIRDVVRGPEALTQYSVRPEFDDYFYQWPPKTLPMLIENDYLQETFFEYVNGELAKNGFDPQEINLSYAIVDVTLEPINAQRNAFSFPFMINSFFNYKGLRIHGPFVAGHQAGLSMVQSQNERRYARYVLPERFSEHFTSSNQTRIIARSVDGIIRNPKVDGLVAALPDRRRDSENYVKSNITRVLTGGRIDDTVNARGPFYHWNENPLRGIPFKVSPFVFSDCGLEVPEFFDDFTYYAFLRPELYETLIVDSDFLRLIDLLRRVGPAYKSKFPSTSQGLLFNPTDNMTIMCALFDRSI